MILGFDEFELDTERLELRRSGKLLKADPIVLRTLTCLASNAGRLVTKDELVENVWEGRPVTDTVITVATARLRKTLGQRRGERDFVENVYGRGYRFVRTVVTRSPGAERAPAIVDATTSEPPFVGRERVLHRLRQALGHARADQGRLCALIGGAGMGKTQLVETFERELVGLDVTVTWGFCRESGDTPPLWPWLRVLRDVVAHIDPAKLNETLGPFADELRALLQATRQDALWSSLGGDTTGKSRHRLFDAILRTLALAAEEAPLVVVFDDLHRADAASLELLAQLTDEIVRSKLLVLATLRHVPATDTRPDTHLPYVVGHRNCERIILEPLTAVDVSQYVSAVLDDQSGALGRAVFDKSEGNPFFMVELVQQLFDMDPPRVEALAVPEAALELIRQRLTRLDDESRKVLCAAAVIGRSFELVVLQAVMDSDPSALMAKLDEALRAEVLVAAPDSATAFAFSHELVRETLYKELSPSQLRHLHLRTARALEQRLAGGDAVPSSELAFHFHAALPEGDPRKAVQYCRQAAMASAIVFAAADVTRYMRHALEALELVDNPSLRLRIALLQMISLYTRASNPQEFRRVTGELVRLATESRDGLNLVQAAAILHPSQGFTPDRGAADTYEKALSFLSEQDVGARALALSGLACTAPYCFDAERCQSMLDEALELAGRVRSRTVSYGVSACRLYLRGGPAHDAEETEVRAVLEGLARENPMRMPVLPADLSLSRTVTALQRGETKAAADSLERGLACSREIGHRELMWFCERARLMMHIETGQGSDAATALSALHRRAERESLLRTATFRAFDQAVVFSELGEAPVLNDTARRQLSYDRSDPPSIWSLKVRALATAGWVEAAHASLRAVAPASLANLPCDRDYLGTLGHIARAALLLGALDYVEALYPLLERYPQRLAIHNSFWCEGSVPHLLGMLSSALDRREAPAQLEEGAAMNERAGLTLRAQQARELLARSRAS